MCIDHNHNNYRESSTAAYLHLHHFYLTTPPSPLFPPALFNSRRPSFRALAVLDNSLFVVLAQTPSAGLRHPSSDWRTVPENDARSVVRIAQTPSTGLRHPSFFGGRCRKAMLGVWYVLPKLQALVYILLSLEEGAGKWCSECGTYCPNSKHWFTTSFFLWRKVPESDARSVVRIAQTPSTGLRHPSFFGGRCRKAMLGVWYVLPRLQALVYDILLSLEEGAGKRCSECGTYCSNSKHWFTTSFFLWRKVPESDARSVRIAITCRLYQRSLCQTPSAGLRHPWR